MAKERFEAVKIYIVIASMLHINANEPSVSRKSTRTIRSSLFTQQRIAQLMETTLLPRELCSLIASYDELRLWKQTLIPQGLRPTMRAVTLGNHVIYSYRNEAGPGVVIWNVVQDTIMRCALPDKKSIRELLPLSRTIFATRNKNGAYILWNVLTGKPISTFAAPHGGACCPLSSKHFALEEWNNSAGADSITIRNVRTGKPLKKWYLGEVHCMKKISQYRLATGSAGGRITVWKLSGTRIGECKHVLTGYDVARQSSRAYPVGVHILHLEALPRHTFASGCEDGSLKIWDTRTGACLQHINLVPPICDLIRLKKSIVTVYACAGIEIWDVEQNIRLQHIPIELSHATHAWSKHGFMYMDEGFAFWEYAWEYTKKEKS